MGFGAERRLRLARGLKAARKKAGLSATQASNRITAKGISCGRGTLLAWERGYGGTSREPASSDLPAIAEVYGCRVSGFFEEVPEPEIIQVVPAGVSP